MMPLSILQHWRRPLGLGRKHFLSLAMLLLGTALPVAAVNVSGTIVSNTTWKAASSPYVVVGDVSVAAGVTLTVEPGVTVKFNDNVGLWVSGALNAVGTSTSGIVFTGSVETADYWRSIFVQNGGSASFDYCTIGYGGYSEGTNLLKSGSGSLVLKHSTSKFARLDGVKLDGSTGADVIQDCTFANNGSCGLVLLGSSAPAVANLTFSSNAGHGLLLGCGVSFDGTTSTFTGQGSFEVYVQGGTLPRSTTWAFNKDCSVWLTGDLTVPAGTTLTIKPGTVVKPGDNVGLFVNGTLDAQGTVDNPIAFTDSRDDTLGGDGNKDGSNSLPAADWWHYVNVYNGGSATLDHCILRYGGYNEGANLLKGGSGTLVLKNSVSQYCRVDGVRLDGSTGADVIQSCTFANNGSCGLALMNSSPTVANLVFSSNAAHGLFLGCGVSFDGTTSTFTGQGSFDVYAQGGILPRSVTWAFNKEYSVWLTGDLNIPAGTTLTIKPGTVVKINPAVGLFVYGTLDAQGTLAAPIWFTDTRDDAVGGDGNRDGTKSVPVAGSWHYINVSQGGSAILDFCRLRYGGYNEGTNLVKSGTGDLTLKNSLFQYARVDGAQINGSTGTNLVQNCIFANNPSTGLLFYNTTGTVSGSTFRDNVWGVVQDCNSYFNYSLNTFSGNSRASVHVYGGTMAKPIAWTKGVDAAGFAIFVASDLVLAADKTLTVSPGVTVKFNDNVGLWINGSLNAVGTSSSGIVFTGDVAVPDYWRCVNIQNAGSANLQYCTFQYGGNNEGTNVLKSGSGNLTLKNCASKYSRVDGVRLDGSTGTDVIQSCSFANNGGSGLALLNLSSPTVSGLSFSSNVIGVAIGCGVSFDDALATFANNTSYDIYAYGGTLPRNTTWNIKKDYSVFLTSDLAIAVGTVLTVKPGTVVKLNDNAAIWVDGTLDAQGTATNPICFTDIRDDAVGGDANRDGSASAPNADWWRAIFVRSAGSATLDYCTVRYGGYYEGTNLQKTGTGNLTLKNSTFQYARVDGVQINGSTGTHAVQNCTFANNPSAGLLFSNTTGTISGSSFKDNVWGVVQDCNSVFNYGLNTFSGNSRASIHVYGGTIANTLSWTKGSDPAGFSIFAASDLVLAADKTLTVSPGVTVKFNDNAALWIDGTLNASGTSASNIVFTGDVESPDYWRAIFIRNAGSATLQYCSIRNGGYYEGVNLQKGGSGSLTLRNSTISNSRSTGIQILSSHTGPLVLANNSYRNNGGVGFWLGCGVSYDDLTSSFSSNGSYDLYAEPGILPRNTVWNLKKDYAFFLGADLTVPVGVVFSIKPGCVVKFNDNAILRVDGTLDAQGTASAPISFTDLRDDTVGGDTNKDKNASAPAADWWRCLYIAPGGLATLDFCSLRYGGYNEGTNLLKTGAGSLTLKNSTLQYSRVDGARIENSAGPNLVQNCLLSNNGSDGLRLSGASADVVCCTLASNGSGGLAFLNSTGSVNGSTLQGNAWGIVQDCDAVINYSLNLFNSNTRASVYVVGGTLAASHTWTRGVCDAAGFSMFINSDLVVAAAKTLSISPGTTVKFNDNVALWVDGTLEALGTVANGIVFTGDIEVADYWRYINVRNAGSANFDYCTIRYGGYNDGLNLVKSGSGALTLKNSTVSHSRSVGLWIDVANTGPLSFANNAYCNNGAHGVVVGCGNSYDDTTSSFSGNGSFDIYLQGGTLPRNTVLNLNRSYAFFLNTDLSVPAGVTLTVKAGTVVKPNDNVGIFVAGALEAQGTLAAPVCFTDLRDDTVGGDTNKDGGNSVPAADWWRCLYLQGSGSAVLDYCILRYGGYNEGANLLLAESSSLTARNCTLGNARTFGLLVNGASKLSLVSSSLGGNPHGLYFNAVPASTTLTNNTFANNTASGVYNVTTTTVDARSSWWGSPTGPYNTPNNLNGKGNAVSSYVLFNPWFVVSASPSTWNAPALGGTQELAVSAGAAWTAASNQSWLTLSKSSGTAGEGTTVLTAAANKTSVFRMATVTFKSGTTSWVVTVGQEPLGDRYEPNDTPETAASGLFPSLGGTADGLVILSDATISNVATSDYYRVEATTAGTLKATLDNLPYDYRVSIYRFNPGTSLYELLGTNAVPGTVSKSLSRTVAAGTYAIRVFPAAVSSPSPTPYRLKVEWTCARVLAVSPTLWRPYKGGGPQEVVVTCNMGWWTASSNQTWLTLSKIAGAGNDTVVLTATQNETTVTRTALVRFQSGAVARVLTVSQPSMADRYEPNNTLETATTSLFGAVGGWTDASVVLEDATIHTINTSDHYRFEVTQPGTLTATLDNLPSDYYAYLYAYDSSTSTWSAIAATSTTGAVRKNLSRPLTAGSYAIRVSAGSTAAASPIPYKLTVAWDGPQDRYEPNNTLETATPGLFSTIGGAVNATKALSDATIHTVNTGDYYKFEVTKAGSLKATLDNLPSNYGAYLYSYSPATASWTLLKATTVAGAVTKSLEKALMPGTYAIRVSAGSGAVASVSPYRLTLAWTATVAQEVPDPVLEMTASAGTVAPEGGTVTLDIVANGPWTLSVDNPRVVASAIAGIGPGRVTLAVGPRTGDASEVLGVTVVSDGLVRTIQIVQ